MGLRFESEEEYMEWERQRREACSFTPQHGGAYRTYLPQRRGFTKTALAEDGTGPVIGSPSAARRSKYGNRRTEIDGKKFDSEHEARVYLSLMDRVMRGELLCVCRQVGFDLPGGVRYIADFVAFDREMRAEVIDAKSPATRKDKVYRLKKRLMRECSGVDIVEM